MHLKEDGKKKILFYCGHPAHFHLIKNSYQSLISNGHNVKIAIKSKDVLENLLKESNIEYFKISNISTSKRTVKYFDAIIRLIRYTLFVRRNKFDLLVGTSWENSKIGKFLNISSICLNEDDANIVPLFSSNAYPGASIVLSPVSCTNGDYEYKTIKYHSFHELAYLHPNNFVPDKNIAIKYVNISNPYFIIRFANLVAHHDDGIKGISTVIAKKIIEILKPLGTIYITSERVLEKEFESYRITVNARDMHHVMAHSSLYIGDSQTMAAEAGVLGIPFIRFNDFVGRIGYLEELENKYQLGYGIKPNNVERLYTVLDELVSMPNRMEIFQERRNKMLSEKIDYASFLTWFIEDYPSSASIMKQNPNYQFKFK